MTKFQFCGCYFTHNIYSKNYKYHFKFINENQFNEDFSDILPNLGCETEQQKSILVEKIQEEILRRRGIEREAIKRITHIEKFYKPLKSDVYKLEEKFLDPQFIKLADAVNKSNYEEIFKLLDIISEGKNIYGFPVFTQELCNELLEELEHFSKSNMPKGRPNSMNYHGVLLDELGFHDGFSLVLREKYMDPLAKVLFPSWRGNKLDSHKIFTVKYEVDKDLELATHYDNSEVTLNVCLGKEFEGGELYFNCLQNEPYKENDNTIFHHKLGYGIMHCGRQLHGAFPIESGFRENLILWMRSSSVRNKLCPMCNSKPKELYPSERYGDGFTLLEESNVATGASINNA